MKLYRASDDDFISCQYSFAADIDSAREYLNNPGYGGENLYCADVEIDEDKVLDLYEMGSSRAYDYLVELTGNDPCGLTPDVWVTSRSDALDAIEAAGYEWVRVCETFPEYSETWVYIQGDEPKLEEVE